MRIQFSNFTICTNRLILKSRLYFVHHCMLMFDAGVVEFGWASWWCKAARTDEAGHRSSTVLPLQRRTAPGNATRRLRQSVQLCVISDVMCRVPRWLWVASAAPRASLQAWISCPLCWQVAEGIDFCACFYFTCHQTCYLFLSLFVAITNKNTLISLVNVSVHEVQQNFMS